MWHLSGGESVGDGGLLFVGDGISDRLLQTLSADCINNLAPGLGVAISTFSTWRRSDTIVVELSLNVRECTPPASCHIHYWPKLIGHLKINP